MNATSKRPSTDELAELEAYLAARQRGEEPAAGEAGFPTGLAGELLELAQQTHPDAAFAARLEGRLRRAAAAAPRKQANHPSQDHCRRCGKTSPNPKGKLP